MHIRNLYVSKRMSLVEGHGNEGADEKSAPPAPKEETVASPPTPVLAAPSTRPRLASRMLASKLDPIGETFEM